MLLPGIYIILYSVLRLFHSSCAVLVVWGLGNHCFYWQCPSYSVSVWPGTARPPYWQKPVYLLDEEDERNNGFVNDDFIIWMRVSAFATFRNLYRRVQRVRHFAEGLPAGNYTFRISYSILWHPPTGTGTGEWMGFVWNSPVSAEPSEGFWPRPDWQEPLCCCSCPLTPSSGNSAD